MKKYSEVDEAQEQGGASLPAALVEEASAPTASAGASSSEGVHTSVKRPVEEVESAIAERQQKVAMTIPTRRRRRQKEIKVKVVWQKQFILIQIHLCRNLALQRQEQHLPQHLMRKVKTKRGRSVRWRS